MKLITLLHLVCTLVLAVSLYIVVRDTNREEHCLSGVETRYNYILRKMCDPTKDSCHIDAQLLNELHQWKLEEKRNCSK